VYLLLPGALPGLDMRVLENSREHLDDFIRLNEEWISTYFNIEDADRRLADNPARVIDDGGYIFTLVEKGAVVGVCALFRESEGAFELARMAVPPEHQRKGYGDLLMGVCLRKLTDIKAVRVFIVSNTKLKTAVSLYKKHGFETTMLGQHPDYSRGNIVLERRAL